MTTKHSALSVLFQIILLACANGQQNFSKQSEDSLLTLLEKNDKAMGSLAVMENDSNLWQKMISDSIWQE